MNRLHCARSSKYTATLPPVVTVCVLQLSEGLTVLKKTLMTGSGHTWL